MPVNQPLGLGDKLRDALSDAQGVLDSMDLRGKLKIDVVPGDVSAAGTESAMDRTLHAAEEARKAGDGDGPSHPGGGGGGIGSDKVTDSMLKLIIAMEKLTGSLGRGGAGAGGKKTPAGTSEAPGPGESDGSGGSVGGSYVNPYLVQGLMRNPIGALKSVGTSWLTGGAGTGIHAPDAVKDMLEGRAGLFSPGKALGSQVEGLGAGGAGLAGLYANPALIAGAEILAPIAAFAVTMKMLMASAKEAVGDGSRSLADTTWGRGTGIGWREGAWDSWQRSRQDIFAGSVRSLVDSSGVGWGQFKGGERGKVDLAESAVESAMNMGVDSGALGGVIGAGVRSGTIAGAGDPSSLQGYLNRIEQWVKMNAQQGFSSAESLKLMAELSQRAQQGAGLLTTQNQVMALSMRENIMDTLPDNLKRTGGADVQNTLGARPNNDNQKVQLMNMVLGKGGKLSPQGEQLAKDILGSDQVAWAHQQMGDFAGTALAGMLADNPTGAAQLRTRMIQGQIHGGASFLQVAGTALSGASLREASETMHAVASGKLLHRKGELARDDPNAHGLHLQDGESSAYDVQHAMQAQMEKRMSSMSEAYAASLNRAGLAIDQFTGAVVHSTTSWIMGAPGSVPKSRGGSAWGGF